MASTLIGSLRVALGLDTAQFEAGANKSKSIARGLSKDIESSFKSAKVAVEGLVAAFAVGALTEQIKQSLQYAAAIGETASTLGVTTKQLQEYRFAAQQSGVAQEQLEGGLTRLAVSMGKAEVGSQAQIKAFNAIGISVDQLKGKNTGQLFEMVADGLKNVTDRAQRAAVEVALFGKSGAQLDSLLAGGTARLNALGQAAQQLGVVLSDEQIQNAEVTAHKLEALKTVLEANIASTVTANANSILSLAQALSTLTNQILHFFSSNPQLALAIIGGLAGSRFGVAGAVLGGAGGALLGQRVAQNAEDQNTDLRFRIKKLQEARDEVNARRAAAADSGSIISFRHGSGGGGTVESALAEFKKQKALLDAATAAALAPKSGPLPNVNLPQFLAGGGGGGRRARTRRQPADRSDEVTAQFEQEQLQADRDILQAKQQLAGSNEQRLAISLQLIDIDRAIHDAEIDEKVSRAKRDLAEGKITQSAYDQIVAQEGVLKAKNDQKAAIEKQALIEEQLARAEQANFDATDQQYSFKIEALQTADDLATTDKDHHRIQLQILDAQIEQKRLELEHEKQLAIRNGATAEEIKVIQDKIDHLSTEKDEGQKKINKDHESPLSKYFSDIQDLSQTLQTTAVQELDKFNDGLVDILQNSKSLKDAWHSLGDLVHKVALDWLGDLEKLALKMAERAVFTAIFGGFSEGGLVGGFADGGFVSGPGGPTSDSIPAMLSNGEFVVNAKSTKKFLPFLEKLNDGALSHVASGGIPIPRFSAGGMAVPMPSGPMPPSVVYQNFDLHGAVVTEDLLRQMDEKSQRAAEAGAQMGVSRMVDLNQRTFGRALSAR